LEMEEKRERALEGIQVLDLANEKASFCSKLLGDIGAKVIKVEKPGGDCSRKIGHFAENGLDPGEGLLFYHNNSNKLGITLNLEDDQGKEIFLKLLNKTDVVIETFDPGYLQGIGLGFDVLRIKFPKLIWVSVTGFGSKGPHSQYKSCDLIATACGGQMSVNGLPSTPPLKSYGLQSYYSASLFAAVGILIALRKRGKKGEGEHIDISLQESVLATLDHVMVRFFYEKTIAQRQGGQYWNHNFYILPCRDGHILMSPFQQWETLVEWMEAEGMAEDLGDIKYREEDCRLSHIDHIIPILKRWVKTHTKEELFEKAQLMHFPWAPVNSLKEVLRNSQLEARKFFIDVEHPSTGKKIPFPSSPYRLGSPFSRRNRSPLIGEDNALVYRGDLGISEEEYQRLLSLNVI
jgi:crotonobetainyl-CoA:carnitine CoA-transferase CaiB-like acyl-CoA transferase